MIAYVDGSCTKDGKLYGSGVVLISDDTIIKEYSIQGSNKEFLPMRNVAGEIVAASIAMGYCYRNKIGNLTIYHDYEGIAKWCTGEWKTNKVGTKKYKEFYDIVSKEVSINFVKVKAHTGVVYNERADILAKQSIGL